MRFLLLSLALLSGGAVSGGPTPAQEQKPQAAATGRVVKFKELVAELRGHKGKVVVVDFWTDGCLECKKEFPHLVQMHQNLQARGFQALAVNLDELTDEPAMKSVKAFLAEQKAPFPCLILDETLEFWQAKLKATAPPLVFLFDRQGKLVKKYEGNVEYAKIRGDVEALLATSPPVIKERQP